MPRVKVEVDGYRCTRCGHEWLPRKDEKPRVCPRCKSPFWDRERTLVAYRADVVVEGRGWPPDRKKLQAFERQLGASRRPSVRSASTHVRAAFDLQAANDTNAEVAARRLVNGAVRRLGLRGEGYRMQARVKLH